VAGCCECGDEPSGSCAMELVFMQFVVMFMIILHTNFHTFGTNRSFVIAMKLKVTYKFCVVAMMFYSIHRSISSYF
jgi:hypothetical protein